MPHEIPQWSQRNAAAADISGALRRRLARRVGILVEGHSLFKYIQTSRHAARQVCTTLGFASARWPQHHPYGPARPTLNQPTASPHFIAAITGIRSESPIISESPGV